MKQSELEKRAKARRNAALKSDTELNLEDRANARRAYFQGGPGPNNPMELGYPGELKYDRMDVPVGGDSRQWEQTWFEGAAEVTKQKMGPSGTELELKKKLQRAKLSAKFTRQANQKDSHWDFFATNAAGKKELLFKASVNDIYGREGQPLNQEEWNWVSSKDYAKFAMEKMRTDGVEKVSYALRGVGITRAGTIAMIRQQALDKARKVVLLGRRCARNLNTVSDKLKTALAHDYSELQSVLEDLRLVEKTAAKLLTTKASNENRFAIYRLADESLSDADLALNDVLSNVKTVEATSQSQLNKKALDMGGATPAYQDVNYGPGGVASHVENPDRAKVKSEVMPGGGIPYEEGGQLYPTPDERQTATLNTMLPAAHGDLPFQEWEQMTLKNLKMGPDGKLRSFDKATWVIEPFVQSTNSTATHGVPTGNEFENHEAGPEGSGLSSVDELQEAGPGLNEAEPRWGFESADENYMHLPFGGLDAAPATEEAMPEEAPAMEEESEPEDHMDEESEESEEAEEPEEEDKVEDEEEEKEAEANDSRKSRSAARNKILSSIVKGESAWKENAKLRHQEGEGSPVQKESDQYWEQMAPGGHVGSKEEADPATSASGELDGMLGTREKAYNALAGHAESADSADREMKASFDAKKVAAQKNEIAFKQKRAYDLAMDFQAKGWIEDGKESLHKHASDLAALDEKGFAQFKKMYSNVKTIKTEAQMEEKVQKIAGTQRKVIKSGAKNDSEYLSELKNLPWS